MPADKSTKCCLTLLTAGPSAQVYNLTTYPNLVGLLEQLGVDTEPSDMSFGLSIDGGALEWGSRGLRAIFAQRRNMFSPSFLRMVWDVIRFGREAPEVNNPCTKHKGAKLLALCLGAIVPFATPHSMSSACTWGFGLHVAVFWKWFAARPGSVSFVRSYARDLIDWKHIFSPALSTASNNTTRWSFEVHCGMLDRGGRLASAGAEAELVCGAQPWTVHQGEGLQPGLRLTLPAAYVCRCLERPQCPGTHTCLKARLRLVMIMPSASVC